MGAGCFSIKCFKIFTTTFAIFFVMGSLIFMYSFFYSNHIYAQIGLAPIPAIQKVLPTYIIHIPPGAVSSTKSNHFFPDTISIPSGTTISWFNDDPGQIHTVTSGLPKSSFAGKLFNSGVIPDGSFYQYTFDIVGTYKYHCLLHPYMTGTVHTSSSYQLGNNFKLTSGASILLDNNGLPKMTLNKTQYNRTLFNFQPHDIAVDPSMPVIYKLKISNDNGLLYENNFQVLGGKSLQVELISSNATGFNTYGPDVTDPITGAYHVEGNFGNGNYTLSLQLISVGSQQISNVVDEFGLRIIS